MGDVWMLAWSLTMLLVMFAIFMVGMVLTGSLSSEHFE